MEWYHWIMIALGIAGFALQAILLLIGGTWKLAQMEQRITSSITQHRREIEDAHGASLDALRREFGEAVTAVRTHLHHVETWSRDEFVRRGSFELVTREIKEAIAVQGAAIDRRLAAIDQKLERRNES